MPDWQQQRHPCGKTDGAAGEAEPIDHARRDQHARRSSGAVHDARHDVQRCTDGHQQAFADQIRQIAGDWTAEQGDEAHRSRNHAHQSTGGAHRFPIAGDDGIDHHVAGHEEERRQHDQCHVTGDQPVLVSRRMIFRPRIEFRCRARIVLMTSHDVPSFPKLMVTIPHPPS